MKKDTKRVSKRKKIEMNERGIDQTKKVKEKKNERGMKRGMQGWGE